MTQPDRSPYETTPTTSESAATALNGSSGGLTSGNRLRAIVAMYAGYAMFMVLRMAPTVAGTSITADASLGVSTGDWGRILALGTIGAVVGKFIGGYAADRLGGRITFTVGLVVSALGVAGFAMSRDVAMFQVSFFIALMAKSAGWPSMTRIIVATFRPQQYGRVWGVLATSSRVGTLIATFCLGGLLSLLSWRSMLLAAAVGGGVMAAVFFILLKQRRPAEHLPPQEPDVELPEDKRSAPQAKPHPLQGTSLAEAIPCFLSSRQFWLIISSLMALTIMWDFLLMVPLYLNQTLGMSEAAASMASSAFPLGSLISVLAGGFVFDSLNRRATAWLMGGLLTVATLCIAGFLWMPQFGLTHGGAQSLAMGLLFTFGLCVSPCYYIPMSVFSIEFGGPHSGFLVALLDAIAFGATAGFYFFAGDIAERSWTMFLLLLVATAVVATVATLAFMLGEAKLKEG